jgi:CNT family concentrative nucleoside transporter
MPWVIKKFAWLFFRTMKVSGAEAVIAAASPFIGQGESAVSLPSAASIGSSLKLKSRLLFSFSAWSSPLLTS